VTGYGTPSGIGDDETPASAGDVPIGGRVESLAAGAWHTCALLAGGMVRCWGFGDDGQLGYANKRYVGDDETPASAGNVEVGGIVVQITAGGNHTCALLAAGTVRCWGYPFGGALGYGNLEPIGDDETPASVGDVPLDVRARQVVAGTNHTCVLTEDNAVRCWGSSWAGQTGYASEGDIGDDDLPSSVPDVKLGGTVELLDAGQDHTCALLSGSRLRCWGRGQEGQLGYGNPQDIGDDEHPVWAGDVAYF
jgi:alpha-tubulin suppressor-like RCC1 family protein